VPPSGKLRRASFDDPGFVTYGYKFVLSGVRYDPQAVVVLVTHRDVPFRQHYIMHVQFVTTRPDRITASTEAMFTARSRR
jgi:hypothetical protein